EAMPADPDEWDFTLPPPVSTRPPPRMPPIPEQREQTYLSTLGGLACVPRVIVPTSRVMELPLDAQAAFVLSQIDGVCSIEDIIDISGLGRLATLQILHDLAQRGAIGVGRSHGG